MLTKKSSPPIKALKFGLAVPLALFFALLFRQSPVLAQSNGEKPASKSADAAPEFPGGMNDLGKFLSDNIVYPPAAKEANAEGVVLISFVVQKEGTLKDIKVIETGKEIHPDLVTEALRVAGKMPKWKPAVKDGKIVKTEFKLPIRFKLDQEAVSELFDVQQAPEFPGGQEGLMKFLADNIKYPEAARKAGVSGLVVVQYVVEKDGSLSTFNTLKSPRPDMAEEAIRVLKSMPKLNPGMKDGQAVRVRYTLPVRFAL